MPFLQRLRGKLWPSNDVFLNRSDEILAHLKTIEDTLRTMKRERDQLKSTVKTLDAQLQRLTSMQEYCSALVRTKSDEAILLAGWYGADNLGDELMMRTLVEYAPESVRKRLWVLAWQNASYDLEWLNELGVRTVRYPRSTEEASLLADSFDTIVWGGGAILDDGQYDNRPGNINTGNLFIRLNEYLLARGKRVFAIGLSTNWQLTSAEYILRLSHIIKAADAFSVRDELSLQVLAASGIDTSRITVCPDVVFGNLRLRELGHIQPRTLTLGFVPMYIKDMHATNKLILDALIEKAASEPGGGRVRLIPFYRSEDTAHFKMLKDQCSRPDLVDIAPYTPDVDGLALRDCSAVVCSRYHAALVAGILGTPFLCVYPDMHVHYQNKCRYLSEIYGCKNALVPASAATSSDIRDFVDSNLAPTTLPHQFFQESSQAIMTLWDQVSPGSEPGSRIAPRSSALVSAGDHSHPAKEGDTGTPFYATETPTVSVVVPAYNNADYLPELIDSVLHQSLTSWQLVIIDDGSTDNTSEVVIPYLAAHPNIEYHVVPNGGPGRARNIGMKYARGTWLLFADADDFVCPNALRDLVFLGEREGCDIVTGNVMRLEGDKRHDSVLHQRSFVGAKEGRTTIYESPTLIHDTSVGNTIYHRDFVARTGMTWAEGHFYEDIATTIPLFFEASSIGVLKEVVYLWKIREGETQSTTQKRATIDNLLDRLKAIRTVDAYFDTHVTDEEMLLYKDYKWLSVDLPLFLNVFPEASEEYRSAAMDAINDYVTRIDSQAYGRLRAIDRIKYILSKRHDAEALAQAVLYDRKHFPGLEIRQADGHFIGSFPFEDITDSEADMTRELSERSLQPRITLVELQQDALKVELSLQLHYIEQHKLQILARLIDQDGQVVSDAQVSHTLCALDSQDSKLFDRKGSVFHVHLLLDSLAELVAQLPMGAYRIELDASFEDISCEPIKLGSPVGGKGPRPLPVLLSGKKASVSYDSDWLLVLRIAGPEQE